MNENRVKRLIEIPGDIDQSLEDFAKSVIQDSMTWKVYKKDDGEAYIGLLDREHRKIFAFKVIVQEHIMGSY